MSILLEALKKSEAQRQLGKTPTLDSPAGSENAAGGDKIWIPAAMLLLTLAIIGWIGIAQFERPEPVANATVSAPAASQESSTRDQAALDGADRSERSAKTPVMDFAVASPEPATEAAAAGKSAVEPGRSVQVAKPNARNRRPGAAASTTEESVAAASPNGLIPGETENSVTETRRQGSDRLEPFVGDSISYWQVPQSVRGDLPDLHISVLVYAENPEDRFLLINGQRLYEKEEFENGMVLDEIRRDRAIFNYRNYRFYLKN